MLGIALLISPPQVVTALIAAALLHEGGHLALLTLFHAPVGGLRLSAMGAELFASTQRLSYGRELLVVLAGPAINLIGAPVCAWLARRFFWEWCYLFSAAQLLLGGYNLLPIQPLDGGRALYLVTAWRWGPGFGEALSAAVGAAAAMALFVLSVWQAIRCGGVLFPLAAYGLLLETFRQRLAITRRVL